jgi:hypothetical protein
MVDRLKDGPWPLEATTLFIKVNFDTNQFEKSWIGKSSNFRPVVYKGERAVRFDVSDLRPMTCPSEYKRLSLGWHLSSSCARINDALSDFNNTKKSPGPTGDHLSHDFTKVRIRPLFFSEMETCDWETFEHHSFLLLRLIGIHDIHKFPQSNNRGKADGFFKFGPIAVLYDATLESNFEALKATQLDNYIGQLKDNKINISQKSYTIGESTKQVWIITRGSEVRHIRTEDSVKVKEIPYKKLVDLYDERLSVEFGVEEMCDKIKNLK